MLLLPALALAAPVSDEVWVELPSPADRARARAAGLAWAEGQEGAWYLLSGTPEMAEDAGLRWRPYARAVDGWIPDADEVRARLEPLAGADATLVQVGESVRGEPLLAIRFGVGTRALRVLGGHHGDEGSSVEVALAVAEAFAAGTATLPPDTELWIVPAVNPDGLAAGTRANANAVDLNRNYDWEWGVGESAAGAAPFSEPETRAVRALARARSFDAGLTLHAGAQNLGWVWNWTADERPVEEPLLLDLALAYGEACAAPGFWLTNGADWYLTNGDTTDWSYGAWGAYDFTLELTIEKAPPAGDIDVYTGWHLAAILGWLAQPPDRTAVVLDAVTGEPIPALVRGDDARAYWTADGHVARFAADESAWTVEAPGYTPAPLVAETHLAPASLLDELPEPRLLSRGDGPTVVRLTGIAEGPVTLVQPGEESVTIEANGSGEWTIDPDDLAPGAWTLEVAEGAVPRALFVGEVDDRVRLTEAAFADGAITLTGTGFAPGAEAWSIGGPARALHALTKVEEAADRLVFTVGDDDDDVLVWTNGAWLAVVDLRGEPVIDLDPPDAPEAPPAEETDHIDPTVTAVGACGGPDGAGGLVLLLALRRRRSSRGEGGPSRRVTSDRDASGLP